ncbi:MAG: tetratricopeptide repeat protein [Candidatus Methanomethylophilaceae archaeon]|jgi:tetratricopeptide (TPR) repeat protein
MSRSDRHLEESLEDYNGKVDECEEGGTNEQRLEAYVNRGCVLSMMDSFTSAMTDFDEAEEVMGLMGSLGEPVDAGTYVKVYVSRGELRTSDGAAGMAEDYSKASERLHELGPKSRHFDEKGIVRMCISCAEDLLDEGYPEKLAPFFDKAERMLFSKTDAWSRNRYVEALNLMGQAEQEMGRNDEAVERYDRSISICQELMGENALDDEMGLIFALVSRGDSEADDEEFEDAVRDYEAAIAVLEVMLSFHRSETRDLLIQIHREVSEVLMRMDETEEAEKHLLRALELNVGDATLKFADNDEE